MNFFVSQVGKFLILLKLGYLRQVSHTLTCTYMRVHSLAHTQSFSYSENPVEAIFLISTGHFLMANIYLLYKILVLLLSE